jgi:hypothetical protein
VIKNFFDSMINRRSFLFAHKSHIGIAFERDILCSSDLNPDVLAGNQTFCPFLLCKAQIGISENILILTESLSAPLPLRFIDMDIGAWDLFDDPEQEDVVNDPSDFYRRVRVVAGCCELTIASEEDRSRGIRFRLWIPSSIQTISESFARGLSFLSCVAFEVGTQFSRLEAHAFSCTGLISMHLPASILVIDASCFAACSSLASITFESESRLSRLEAFAFACTGLISIHLPASIEFIGKSSFSECTSLDYI